MLGEAIVSVVLVGGGGLSEFQRTELQEVSALTTNARAIPVLMPGASLPVELATFQALDLRGGTPADIERKFNELALSLANESAPADGGTTEAAALAALGLLELKRGDLSEAQAWYERALDRFQATDDQRGIAEVFRQLGVVAQQRGDLSEAQAWYERALDRFQATDDQRGIAEVFRQLGVVAQQRGDLSEAQAWYERALDRFQATDDQRGIAATFHELGVVAQQRGVI